MLSWELEKAGEDFLVADEYRPNSPSRVAAGIINPITGRRHVKTWMADVLLPHAKMSYDGIGKQLGICAIAEIPIIEFFATPQMQLAFEEALREEPNYLHYPNIITECRQYFNFDFGLGQISPAFQVNLPALLNTWRNHLRQQGRIVERTIDLEQLSVSEDGVIFEEIRADYIIFCDGSNGAGNPFFLNLPFAPNKGESIIFRCEGLPTNRIFKKGFTIAPVYDNHFWIGSSYEWTFDDLYPSEVFRMKIQAYLTNWLKLPFTIVEHQAAARPATLERRPFAGVHPQFRRVAILNGMGTKGCSLAPYFAEQLVNNLLHGSPIEPGADVARFKKILLKNRV